MTSEDPFRNTNQTVLKAMRPLREVLLEKRPELADKIDQLLARIQKDYPDIPAQGIYVIDAAAADQMESLRSVPIVNNLKDSIYRMVGGVIFIMPPGIYMRSDYIDKLTDKEFEFMIAHESGHHYLDHFSAIEDTRSRTRANAIKKTQECEADHFAGHYVEGAHAAADSLFAKVVKQQLDDYRFRWRESLTKQAEERPELDIEGSVEKTYRYHHDRLYNEGAKTHPAFNDRLQNLIDVAAGNISPGRIKFDGTCTAVEIDGQKIALGQERDKAQAVQVQ